MMPGAFRVLIVEDETLIRLSLRDGLVAAGYEVSQAVDERTASRCLQQEHVDLVTIDVGLGRENGLDIAQTIRGRRNVPIIMITGRVSKEDRIRGLENGADDYIVKPFEMREVILRIRNVLRRYNAGRQAVTTANEQYRIDAGLLDIPRRQLLAPDGAPVDLTETEFDLLAIFVRHPQRILSRDEVMQLLRGRQWTPFDRTLDKHVAGLRKKIESPSGPPRLIKSVRSVGYVFAGAVERVEPGGFAERSVG